jgi:IS1 family transposase
MENYEDDGPWMWVAFAPSYRLIVAFVIGPRKQYVADELVKLTARRLSEPLPLFVSDGLEFYGKALLKQFGEIIEFPRTGKRGRPKNPKRVPSDYLNFAQVIKNRKGGKLKKIVKKIIFGKDIEETEISTSLLERQNLTFRQDNNRISRKTIGFSKKIEYLINRMILYCTYFNFCREHGGLTYQDENCFKRKNTPTREAGITQSKWTLKELLRFRCFKTSTV